MTGVVELNLNGHTNICGTNASGKTTLQRLIPVFYGEYPSRVVPATRDSFERWYLPQSNSYIIYEYLRGEQDSDVCQVVLTSSGKGVDYRLINKAFELTDYLSAGMLEGQHAANPVELVRTIKRDGILCSRKLNTKEFKSIIQNDRSILASHRDLPGYARLFSLCDGSNNLRHIEKLAKAVHSKEGKMETIKAMVAAILEEDGVTPGETKLSPTKVDEWIRECKLIKGFEEIRPDFTKLEASYTDYNQILIRLAELKHQISIDQTVLSSNKSELEGAILQNKMDAQQLESQWSEQRDTLNQSLSAAKSDVEIYTSKLDEVESVYDTWQDKEIETHKDNLEKLPRWNSELSSAESRLSLLTEQHQDVEGRYNKQLLEIREQHADELEAYKEQKESLKDLRTEKIQQQHQQLMSLESKFKGEISQLNNDFKEQKVEIDLEITKLTTLANNVGFTQQEQQQIELLEQTINEATELEDLAREKHKQVNDELAKLKSERHQQDLSLQTARQEVAQQQTSLNELNSVIFPGEGTLLEFLRSEKPGWQQSIGKVINPALLRRKDMQPSLVEDENSLFGLNIDADNIELPSECANESDLQTKLHDLELAIKESLEAQHKEETSLAELNNALRAAEVNLAKVQSDVNNALQNRKRAVADKSASTQAFQIAQKERKQHYLKQISSLKSNLQSLQLKQNEALEDVADQQRDAEMELKTHWQSLVNDIEQQLAQVESHITQCQVSLKTELKQLEKWQKDELNNRGVDVDDIGDLKRKIKTLKADITETEKQRNQVLEFNVWYQTNYVKQKVTWQQQLSDARQLESQSKRDLDKALNTYKQTASSIKTTQNEAEKSLKHLLEQEYQAQSVLAQMRKLKLTDSVPQLENGSISQRLSEATSLMAQREEQLSAIKHYVESFDQKIAAQSGTGFYDAWERSRELCSVIDEEGVRHVDPVKLVPELDQLINGLIPQKLNSIREQGRIFGLALSEYYKILKDIEKHIGLQSERISKEVDEELFLDGVSDSAVKICSKIDELEFWPDLQRFSELYGKWIEAGAHELPTDEYAASMRRVIDILGKAALAGGISKLLDIELHMKESGRDLIIRTDRQLNESSSHGMAYLILCKFLLAFTRLLRGPSSAIIHWPIDELGTLHQSNIKKIFDACQNNQIHVVGAFPNPESEVLSLFKNRYLIDKQKKQLQVVEPKVSPISERIKAKMKNESSNEVSA